MQLLCSRWSIDRCIFWHILGDICECFYLLDLELSFMSRQKDRGGSLQHNVYIHNSPSPRLPSVKDIPYVYPSTKPSGFLGTQSRSQNGRFGLISLHRAEEAQQALGYSTCLQGWVIPEVDLEIEERGECYGGFNGASNRDRERGVRTDQL